MGEVVGSLMVDLHIFLGGFFALNREFLMLTAVTKNMPVVLRHFADAQKPQALYNIGCGDNPPAGAGQEPRPAPVRHAHRSSRFRHKGFSFFPRPDYF